MEKIARNQVMIEYVESNLELLQKEELTQEQMKDLLTSFRDVCMGFKDCLEDLAIYVKRYEQKR